MKRQFIAAIIGLGILGPAQAQSQPDQGAPIVRVQNDDDLKEVERLCKEGLADPFPITGYDQMQAAVELFKKKRMVNGYPPSTMEVDEYFSKVMGQVTRTESLLKAIAFHAVQDLVREADKLLKASQYGDMILRLKLVPEWLEKAGYPKSDPAKYNEGMNRLGLVSAEAFEDVMKWLKSNEDSQKQRRAPEPEQPRPAPKPSYPRGTVVAETPPTITGLAL